MAIVIIRDDERLETEFEGGIFYYKRIKSTRRSAILQQYTSRNGNTDFGKSTDQILRECLLGWGQVVERDGTPVAFDIETIRCLPDDAQNHIIEKIGANIDILESDSKNLPSTPGSNFTTKVKPVESAEQNA